MSDRTRSDIQCRIYRYLDHMVKATRDDVEKLISEANELERHLAESADHQRERVGAKQKEINALNILVDSLARENRELNLRVQAMQSLLSSRKLRAVEAQLERLAEQEADGDTDTDDDSCVEEVS